MVEGGGIAVVASLVGSLVACTAPVASTVPVPSPTASVPSTSSAGPSAPPIVQDVSVVEGSRPASLVMPAQSGAGGAAGILWFHWLEYGAPTSNRTEFLDEARSLADRGVVSVLVDGTFPWHEDPESISHDTAALQSDLEMARSAYALLLSRPEVDAARTVLVGHDFGAMYESVLFAADDRPLGLVMMAPTARWADWFYRYWQISDEQAAYAEALRQYDPVEVLPRAGDRPILLQFADDDRFVPAQVAEAITAAAGDAADSRTYSASHELNEAARQDRDEWLADLLQLAADR